MTNSATFALGQGEPPSAMLGMELSTSSAESSEPASPAQPAPPFPSVAL